jgi:hypothetical protein
VYELSKQLVRHCDEASRHALASLLSLCTDVTAAGLQHVSSVLSRLLEEATGTALEPHTLTFDATAFWHQAQQLGARELEAKAQGNLALSAQLRRELITCLHEALTRGLDSAERTDQPFTALSPARHSTEAQLDRAQRDSERHLHDLVVTREAASAAVANVQRLAQGVEDSVEMRKRDVLNTLAESDREITSILADLDALYDRLELAVHSRNNKLKGFVKARATLAVKGEITRREAEAKGEALRVLQARECRAQASVAALQQCSRLKDSVRLHVESRNQETIERLASESKDSTERCDEFYSELSSCVHAWTEVLMRNVSRETEREAQLQQSVEEATERYHQADRDLFTQQLADTGHRRKLAQAEIVACDTLLQKATARMERLGRSVDAATAHHHHYSYATDQSATRAPSGHSRPATPQHTATPRFAAAPLFATPLPSTHTAGAHRHHSTPLTSPVPRRGVALTDDLVPTPVKQAVHVDPACAYALVVASPRTPPRDVYVMRDAVDEMSAADIVDLFRKSPTVREKWLRLLVDMDVETGREIRCLRDTARVWETVLPSQPLLKSLLEQLLDAPQRFVELEEPASS